MTSFWTAAFIAYIEMYAETQYVNEICHVVKVTAVHPLYPWIQYLPDIMGYNRV
mgnify:CR=1 FL=1